MEFKEDLPEACPPADAEMEARVGVYRLLSSAVAVDEHFYSHAKLGIGHGCPCECQRSACSLFSDKKRVRDIAKRFPKTRKKTHIAELDIPSGSGYLSENGKGHINFWMFAGFDPLMHIVGVEEL